MVKTMPKIYNVIVLQAQSSRNTITKKITLQHYQNLYILALT